MMRFHSFCLLILVMSFFFSCAGTREITNKPPEWVSEETQDTENLKIFRGEGTGGTQAAARNQAADDLWQTILTDLGIADTEQWNDHLRSAAEEIYKQITNGIRTTDFGDLEGLSIFRQAAWNLPGGEVSYAVDVAWDKEAYRKISGSLLSLANQEFVELDRRAEEAAKTGSPYEAALLWSEAAALLPENSQTYSEILAKAVDALNQLKFQVRSVPAFSFAGLRPQSPVIFAVVADGTAVSGAECVITYPGRGRDGSAVTETIRTRSDANGIIRFLPPEIAFPGTQIVTIAPSAQPFTELLGDVPFLNFIENPQAQGRYEAESRMRTIPTGILVLEMDLAGNPLIDGSVAQGVYDSLTADGFQVDVINLSAGELVFRTDATLLRDLKADSRFSGEFDRVIHGTVSLESFEQSGEGYSVRVAGVLKMSDIQRQVVLYESKVVKTARASDGQQAISTAFRQLGRAFAGELTGN